MGAQIRPHPRARVHRWRRAIYGFAAVLIAATVLLRYHQAPAQHSLQLSGDNGRVPTHWVVFSTNENPMYSFFAPLTAWAWAHRVGWRSLVLVSEGVQPLVREAVQWAGGEVLEVPQGGWPTSTLLQVARIVAAAAIEADDDVLTTSDVDMLPLDAAYFHALDVAAADVHVQGNHRATLRYHQYPICYVTMTVGTWKRVMRTGTTRNLSAPMAPLLRASMGWDYDQVLLIDAVEGANATVKFYDWSGSRRMDYRQRKRKGRGLPSWQEGAYIDSHLLRPGFTSENWPKLRASLLDHVLDSQALAYFEGYRKRFVAEVMRGDDVAEGLVDGKGRRW